MQKIIDFNSQKDHYQAQACVLWCLDSRFKKALDEFVKNQGWEHFDLIKLAGGAKNLVSPEKETDRDFVLRQIECSLRLHHTEKIILMNHLDCGAYGGSKNFTNETVEKEFLIADLREAQEFLKNNLSVQKPVNLVLVDFSGLWQI